MVAWQLSVLAVRTDLQRKSALMTLLASMLRFVPGLAWIGSTHRTPTDKGRAPVLVLTGT